MLNICITADHELFSGTNLLDEKQVMIEPTKRLLDLLEVHQIPLTLFTDVCSIDRYRQLLPNDPYPELMEEQLCYARSRGHDVQLHIHPHWYDSYVLDGQWMFDLSRFRLQDWGFDPDDPNGARAFIRKGKRYLEDLLKPVDPNYQCRGFRAGGWCIQPEGQLLKALLDEGIWIDSTVFRGGYNPGPDRGFDFRHAPDMDSWWVDPDRGILHPADAGPDRLFEITIGSSGRNIWNSFPKARYKLERFIKKRSPVTDRGCCLNDMPDQERTINDRFRAWIGNPVELSYDNACARAMMDIVGRYARMDSDHKHEGDSYICAIGHPKALQEDDYSELDCFCRVCKRRFGGAVRFVTIGDIADMLSSKREK